MMMTYGRLLLILVILIIGFSLAACAVPAYAHFFGATKEIENYQVIFQPAPAAPVAGSNSTRLNFSVLENGTNIFNIHSALTVTEKGSGEIVAQTPYRQYEFSDITIPYTFQEPGDYVVTFETRITGDEKYQATPLAASFDLSVADPNQIVPFDELMLFYVTPAAAAIAGIVVYLHSKKKL
jgi:hypothetical protein